MLLARHDTPRHQISCIAYEKICTVGLKVCGHALGSHNGKYYVHCKGARRRTARYVYAIRYVSLNEWPLAPRTPKPGG
ncbi:hypothetical protein EVAR_2519_1 [Eumeta japonica]|uniref:Uncharacterized protein n=1 Tax=Eumeta variegata TaxID=151549 RepID=A0A4C1SRJ9_EUMVA|nr:hypothetical protein EVAR_2519_1 [Eumeta japonica]